MTERAAPATLARDTGRLADALKRGLATGVDVETCELIKVARPDDAAPDAGLVASYRVVFHDPSSDTRTVQFYCGHVLRDHEAFYERWRRASLVGVAHGEPLIHEPALAMVLFAFPNDPQLTLLAECFTREAVEACLANAEDLAGDRLLDYAITPLKHDPGRGCACRVALSVERAGTRRTYDLIAKVHKSDRMGRTFNTMSRLWQAPAFRSALWTIPRPLSYDASRHLLWQSALPGSSFWSLHHRIDVAAIWRDMARAAAVLHAIEFAPPGRSLDALPDSRADVLSDSYPELGTWRTRLMSRLLERRDSFEPIEPRSLHGDFHPDQFLIDDDRIALTDFDTAAWGDPAYDPARFASHVILKALQRDLDAAMFDEPLAAFLDAYLHDAPPGVSRARVFWHTAAQLLGRRVYKIVKQETASPREKIESMLRVAEDYLNRSLDARSTR